MNNSNNVLVVNDDLLTLVTNSVSNTTLTTPLISSSSGNFISTNTTAPSNNWGTISSPTGFTIGGTTYNDFWKFDEQFDLMWKSFFDPTSGYRPIREKIVTHPCDIQETDLGLRIDIAAVGLDIEDLDIIVDSETLRIAYRKPATQEAEEKSEYRYFQRSIKKASFDIAWKISSKFDLHRLEANLDKGLLTLDIPYAKENKPKKIQIKSKQLLKS